MLKIENLTVKTKDKMILDHFDIEIKPGEVHAIMGPNGTGKSTLSKVIMGCSDYEIIDGAIFFEGDNITLFSPDERARKGLFLAFQTPLSIEGVTNSEFLRAALQAKNNAPVGLYDFIKELDRSVDDLEMSADMLHRSVNQGASGGERKKNEILQMKLLKPKCIILDEIDSGLDVDSLKVVCQNINEYRKSFKDTSILIITHYPRVLEYIKPTYVHVLQEGHIAMTGDASLAFKIEKNGYSKINNVGEIDIHE